MRRQAPDRTPARRARGGLHRGRLARLEPEGRRVLRARSRDEVAARPDRRVRLDLPRGRRARGRREHQGAPRLRRPGLHRGREDLDAPRDGRPPDDARGQPPHHRAEPRVPEGERAAGDLRRRALLRRLPRRPGLRARDAQGGGARRGGDARPVRHERRRDAVADRGDGPRGPRRGEDAARRPRAQRQRDGRRELARRRDGGRRPDPGDDQRLRRAVREREPLLDHPVARAEAREEVPARGAPPDAHRGLALRGGGREPRAGRAPRLRRQVRLRAQGRHPRRRDAPDRGVVPAHRAGARRQPAARRRLRALRARQPPLEGRGVRARRAATSAGC